MDQTQPQFQLASWCTNLQRSVLRQMIAVVSQPGILSFAGGLPAPEFFPVKDFSQAIQDALSNDPLALQYRPPYDPLKRHVVQLMNGRGVECSEDQVFITTGAQQGLDVLSRMLLNYGGEIILEEIIYTGVQQVVNPLQPKIYTVKTDIKTGVDVDGIEELLKTGVKPAFIYLVPNAQNPLGVSISLEKRKKLVQLARQYRVPILEDDPYGLLKYDSSLLPTLKSLDPDWVIYLGSFSKIIAPALRCGWMICPSTLIPTLTVIKEACDLETSALTQRAISYYLDQGKFEAHLQHLCSEYKKRRDVMLNCLRKYFPSDSIWTEPDSGMFIWVVLRKGVNGADLLKYCLENEKVAFIPGYAFAVPGTDCTNCIRLNFSNAGTDKILDGMERLGRAISTYYEKHSIVSSS